MVNRVKAGLAGLLIGAGSMMNGCGVGEYIATKEGGDVLAGRTVDNIGNAIWGHEERKREAREGRSEVNQEVNVYGNSNSKRDEFGGKTPFSTAFRYWLDSDNDGLVDPNELIGRGNVFSLSQEDEIKFGTKVDGKKGDQIGIFIYSASNKNINASTYWSDITKDVQLFTPEFSAGDLRGLTGKVLVNFRVRDRFSDGFGEVSDSYYVYLEP